MTEEQEMIEAAQRFQEIARLVDEQNRDQQFCTYYDSNISVEAFESNSGYDPNDQEYLQKVAEEA